jgi:hypothetical protein
LNRHPAAGASVSPQGKAQPGHDDQGGRQMPSICPEAANTKGLLLPILPLDGMYD